MKEEVNDLAGGKLLNEPNIDKVREKIVGLLDSLDNIDFYIDKITDAKTGETIAELPSTLMDMMKEDGLSAGVVETIEQMEESSRNLGQSFVQGAQGAEVFKKTVEKNEETLKGFGKNTFNVSNGIVSMSEAFMGLAGSVNAIKSIVSAFDDLKNGAVSTSEGITQLITGFTMLGTSGV